MTVLSDTDILQALEKNDIGIEPLVQKNLTPNGYDLTVDEIFIRRTNVTMLAKASWQVSGRSTRGSTGP